jgi:hypothetical protein
MKNPTPSMHVSVLGPNNQIQDNQKYHAAQVPFSLERTATIPDTSTATPGGKRYGEAGRACKPSKLTYSQKIADRRDAWLEKVRQEVEEQQRYLDRMVAADRDPKWYSITIFHIILYNNGSNIA